MAKAALDWSEIAYRPSYPSTATVLTLEPPQPAPLSSFAAIQTAFRIRELNKIDVGRRHTLYHF